ncbi:Hypothetical protein PBC10988_2350 [Planctomycetales bacterium 10988]|nr:Hypothetical protein PBC10988_2350 [Planctomycetales bacterium 10988]
MNTPPLPPTIKTSEPSALSTASGVVGLAVITILHALAYGSLYGMGTIHTIEHYLAIVPVIGQLVVAAFGTLAMILQLIAALLLLFRSLYTEKLTRPSTLCLVVILGLAVLGAAPFGVWSEVLLVFLSILWPLTLHFVVKRLIHSKPIHPVFNTLIFVWGAILLLITVGIFLVRIDHPPFPDFDPIASFPTEEKTPLVVSLSVEGQPSPLHAPSSLPSDHPDVVLSKFVGRWRISADDNGKASAYGEAISLRLEEEPWVVCQMSDLAGVLRGIQVIGFDQSDASYHYYSCVVGVPSSHYVGQWDASKQEFTWSSPLQEGKQQVVIRESIGETSIRSVHSLVENGVTLNSFKATLDRLPFHPDESWNSPLLDRYEGKYRYESQTTFNESKEEVLNRGLMLFRRLPATHNLVKLYFNEEPGRLADVQFYYHDLATDELMCFWIAGNGQPQRLLGTPSSNHGQVTWQSAPDGEFKMILIDFFSGDELRLSRADISQEAEGWQMRLSTFWERIEE